MSSGTYYSASTDGVVQSSNAVYATARSGSTLTIINAGVGANGLAFGQRLNGGTYYVWETFLGFDTSAIPETATITSAILSIYIDTDGSTTNFITDAYISAWGPTLATTDYIAGANLGALTKVATLDSTGATTGAHNAFTNVAMPANIDKAGTTYILLASANTASNTAPTGDEYLLGSAQEYTGTDRDPKLTVAWTHSVTLGLNTETDSALAMTVARVKSVAVGLNEETDSALGMTVLRTWSPEIGLNTETDSALAMTVRKTPRYIVYAARNGLAVGATRHDLEGRKPYHSLAL